MRCPRIQYCQDLCKTKPGREIPARIYRIITMTSIIFFILSILFCGLMLHPQKPLKLYLPLFATSLCLSFLPIYLSPCVPTPLPRPDNNPPKRRNSGGSLGLNGPDLDAKDHS